MFENLSKITKKREMKRMERDSENYKKLAESLEDFRKLKVVDKQEMKEVFSEIRAMFLPYLDEKYMQSEENGMLFELYDPSYLGIVDRAISGIQSYHIPPNDEFFRLDSIEFGQQGKQKIDTDLEAALAKRQEEIHNIIQFPENYVAETSIQRDKFLFGFCGKVIDYDETIVARIMHYPPESVMVGSSNGKYFDVYGVCEMLSWQQIKKRYPKPLSPNIYEGRDLKFGASVGETIYRMNIPKNVLIDHLQQCASIEFDEEFLKFVKNKFSGSKDKNWVDIHFTQDEILEINVQSHRNIMVPTFAPGASQVDLSKGVGERSVPLVVLISELEVILLTGAERTYAPAWLVNSEVQASSLRLGRNEITFGDSEKAAQNLSLNADIRGMVELKDYKIRVLERLMFLDVFELIHKNRMTSKEVDYRRSDDFRKLGLFLTADEMTNLNPSVLLINKMIHETADSNNKLSETLLKAVYSSPIAFSHRDTAVDKAAQVFQLIAAAKELDMNDSPINDYFDYSEYVASILSHIGVHSALRAEDERNEKINARNERQRIADLAEQTRALNESNQLGRQTSQEQQGGGPEGIPQGNQPQLEQST